MKRSRSSTIVISLLIVVLVVTACATPKTTPDSTTAPLSSPTVAIPVTPTTISHQPLSADEVKTIAAEFERISWAHLEAWSLYDTDLMRPLYTDDIVLYEAETWKGIDDVLDIDKYVIEGNTHIINLPVAIYIDRSDGFDVWEVFNWSENIEIEYNLYTLREGKISEWQLLWGTEGLKAADMEIHTELLPDYAAAWSSGDPEEVASLYDPKIVRQDSLFGENQQGISAVKEYARDFFSWYPGVRLELLRTAELFHSYPYLIGSVYTIHVANQAGNPCEVHAIILLGVSSEGLIRTERLFYEPDSLLACDWAQ